jgi:hypothetical protein
MMTITKAIITLAGALLITPAAAEEQRNTYSGAEPMPMPGVRPPVDEQKRVFHYFPKSLKDAGYAVGPNGIPEIRDVQARLHELGYKITVDGLPGPATEDALRAFQEKHHLPETGTLDPETFVKLWTPDGVPIDLKNNCKDC